MLALAALVCCFYVKTRKRIVTSKRMSLVGYGTHITTDEQVCKSCSCSLANSPVGSPVGSPVSSLPGSPRSSPRGSPSQLSPNLTFKVDLGTLGTVNARAIAREGDMLHIRVGPQVGSYQKTTNEHIHPTAAAVIEPVHEEEAIIPRLRNSESRA